MGHPHFRKFLSINNKKGVPDTLKNWFSLCPKKMGQFEKISDLF